MRNPVEEVSCNRGAPMGRANHSQGEMVGDVYLTQIALTDGGYDAGGAYWGIGQPLWYAEDTEGEGGIYFRAGDVTRARVHVRSLHPQVTGFLSPPIEGFDISAMVQGYLDCAEWLAHPDDDEDGSGNTGYEQKPMDWEQGTEETVRADCEAFVQEHGGDITGFRQLTGRDESMIGHDLFLSRERHGTGFWDRGGAEFGDRLHKASRGAGPGSPMYDAEKLYFAE